MAFSNAKPPDYINDIYLMDPDGSNQINLTKSPGLNELYPDFSPNGSQVCFSHYNTGAQKAASGIYVMDVDGSDPTLVFEDALEGQLEDVPVGPCDWSPDGTKIAFHAIIPDAEGDYKKAVDRALAEGDLQKAQEKLENLRGEHLEEVYVINADASGKTNLTNNPAADADPEWSPDGTKITFASDRDGDFDIYTMDADGSDVAQVTNAPMDDIYPDWQPLPGTTAVHPPPTGGPSLLLVACALLFSGGVMFYAGLKRSV